MNIKNKIVVITGGSDGLGLSLTKKFSESGAKVHIIARDKVKLDTTVKLVGKNVLSHIADVSNFSEIQKVATEIGKVDVLINNAGVWIEGSIINNSEKEISTAIDINLKGVIYTSKVFIPNMMNSDSAHLINISSTSGLKGRAGQAVYVASKFGVAGFTDSLKADLADTNIKVSGFYPGGMQTGLFKKAGSSKRNPNWMNTDKVAEIIVFMVEQDSTMVLDHVVLNKRKTQTSN